jgi:peptidoglycan glycosyltransferase
MTIPTPLRSLLLFASLGLIFAGLLAGDRIDDARWLAILGGAWLCLLLGLHIDLPSRLPTFNRSLIRVGLTFMSVFVLISAQLVRVQVVQSDETFDRIGIDADGNVVANARATSTDLSVDRGRIYDRDGNLIADTVEDDGEFLRSYPDPTTAYVAGYFSPLLYGSVGLERTWNDQLAGRTGSSPVDRWMADVLHQPQQGLDLNLTLDADLQRQATDLLGGRTGAVVVMDVNTGAIVTLVSAPVYDPNRLFTANTADNPEATAYWNTLLEDEESPLLLRSTLGLYTPGSTFKTVTSAIAIENGIAEPSTVYEDNGSIVIDGRELIENNRPDESRDQWTLEEGVGWSLNVVLAQVGLQVGADSLWEGAAGFGIGEAVPFDLVVGESQLASDRSFLDSQNALADTAFGQGEILVSPIQMVMIASCFANDGQMMQPYLVDTVTERDGDVVQTVEPTVWKTPISAMTANDVADMMVYGVEEGSMQRASGTGYRLGGKTGTAETGDGDVNSWFIGFIGDDDPQYAVAVVLEDDTSGLGTAVDIGSSILVATMESPPAEGR